MQKYLGTLSTATINESNNQFIWGLNVRGFLVISFYNYLTKNDAIDTSFPFRQISKINASIGIDFLFHQKLVMGVSSLLTS